MDRNPWVRVLIILLVFIAIYYLAGLLWQLGQQLGDIILLFFLAWLLSFTLSPIARFLTQYNRHSKILAVVEVYLGLFFLMILLSLLAVPAIASQLYQIGNALPVYFEQAPQTLSNFQHWLEQRGIFVDLSTIYPSQLIIQRAETLGTAMAQNALGIAQGVASALLGFVIVLVLSFYMMIDGERITQGLVRLLPQEYREEGRFFLDSIDRTFGGFIRGSLIQAAIYGVGTGLVMSIGGLSYAIVVSAFAGLVMVIPFVGTFFAIIPPILIALFAGSLGKLVFVSAALLVLQQIVINLIAPKVMSESVGVHPLLIFLAMLLGAKVAGIWGAIFGVPIMGVVCAMVSYVFYRFQRVGLAGSEPRAAPSETVVLSKGG